MVYVKLEQDWTDGTGGTHVAGAMVDVDVSTLARLEAQGLVADPGAGDTATVTRTWTAQSGGEEHKTGDGDDPESWIGPTGGDGGGNGDGGGGDDPESWIGPTGGDGDDAESWPGPTGGDGQD